MNPATTRPTNSPYSLTGQYSTILALSRAVDRTATLLADPGCPKCLAPDHVDACALAAALLQAYIQSATQKG